MLKIVNADVVFVGLIARMGNLILKVDAFWEVFHQCTANMNGFSLLVHIKIEARNVKVTHPVLLQSGNKLRSAVLFLE